MQKQNVEFTDPDCLFYFSHREVFGHFNMKTNHFHNQYELYYLFSGERYYFIKDRIFHIQPGNLVLINKNDLHKTTDAHTADHVRTVINFNLQFLTSSPFINDVITELFEKSNFVIPFLPSNQQYVEVLLNKMIIEIKNKEIGFEILLQALLTELLVYTRRWLKGNQNSTLIHPSPMHEQISTIVQHINNNFHKNLSLSTISKEFFVSPYYLSRTFKETTGFTFIEYINSIRIREAQRLLIETNDKVIDIAEKVGFGNVSHFGRVFKEITHFSPLNYRKLNKKSKTLGLS